MSQTEREILIAVTSTAGIIIVLMAAFLFFLHSTRNRIREKELEVINAVLDTQEKEQERIARDLHDQIGPLLSIIKSQVECINDSELNVEDKKIKNDVGEQLGFAIKEVRSIAHNLIPNTFSEYGFLKSIEYYILRIKEYNNIQVDFKSSTWPTNVKENYEVSLYRILLELFQNTIKHSKATQINLELHVKKNILNVIYSDNGIGMKVMNINNKGFGLKNIEARVSYLKGSYKFETKQNVSTDYSFKFDMKNLYGNK